jgi:hypothetical protein
VLAQEQQVVVVQLRVAVKDKLVEQAVMVDQVVLLVNISTV